MDNLTDETPILPPVAEEQPAQPPPAAAPEAPAAPARSRTERREQASADALRGLIRDFLLEKYPAIMEAGEPLLLSIDLLLEPGEPGALRFEPDLRRQVSEQVQVLLAPRDAFEEGAVYDFQQNSPRVPGCRPPEPDAVFAGYDNLGRAKWHSFTQCLLDARDPRVDQVAGKAGRPVSLLQKGKDLRSEQLSSHGRANKAYSLLGQLSCGYFSLPPAYAKTAGGDKLALTFQIVETRDTRGDFALRLNLLAGGLLATEVKDLLQEPAFRRLAAACDHARGKTADIERRAREALAQRDSDGFQRAMRRVPAILQDLANDVENPSEPARAPQPDPRVWTGDVAEARPDDLFFDSPRESWVLLGSRGKAHAFSTDGRYITTFPVTAAMLEQRIVSGRWVAEHADRDTQLARMKG
jgi:hypothetical protein